MDIKKNNEMPVIGKWIIRYDDVWNMPLFVQGSAIGYSEEYKNGQTIQIKGIESIDLKANILKTYDGKSFKLIGSGKRMVLIDENEILEICMKDVDDFK